jgi:hypothetical protein
MKQYLSTWAMLMLASHLCLSNPSYGCSMTKIVHNGKTFVGNNEDSWATHPIIWFETNNAKYDVAYLGQQRNNELQGAINEIGLVYDAFLVNASDNPSNNLHPNRTHFLKSIMQNCSSVREVKKYIEKENKWLYTMGMLWFVDAYGESLVVEPDSMFLENEPYAALSNFRPSDYPDRSTIPISRYHRAMKLMSQGLESTHEYCATVMDTMHSCRGSLGEGTLYKSVYDLDEKLIYFYFYHDYNTEVKFDLLTEFDKGDHTLNISQLFPKNLEYKKLLDYKTPFNSGAIYWILIVSLVLALSLSIYLFVHLVIQFIKQKRSVFEINTFVLGMMIATNMMICTLMPILLLREPIFYFGINGSLRNFPITTIEHFPSIIGILSIPILIWVVQTLWKRRKSLFYSMAITLNTFMLLTITGLSFYWGLMRP